MNQAQAQVPTYTQATEFSVERTFDDSRAHAIMGDPELLRRAGELPVEAYSPSINDLIIYLIASRSGVDVGVLIFHMLNDRYMYQGHLNYLPKYWGTGLEQATKMACQWIFDNTECIKIVGLAPDVYPEVERHGLKSGFSVEGVLSSSTVINGAVCNQKIMGLSKWQQQL